MALQNILSFIGSLLFCYEENYKSFNIHVYFKRINTTLNDKIFDILQLRYIGTFIHEIGHVLALKTLTSKVIEFDIYDSTDGLHGKINDAIIETFGCCGVLLAGPLFSLICCIMTVIMINNYSSKTIYLTQILLFCIVQKGMYIFYSKIIITSMSFCYSFMSYRVARIYYNIIKRVAYISTYPLLYFSVLVIRLCWESMTYVLLCLIVYNMFAKIIDEIFYAISSPISNDIGDFNRIKKISKTMMVLCYAILFLPVIFFFYYLNMSFT